MLMKEENKMGYEREEGISLPINVNSGGKGKGLGVVRLKGRPSRKKISKRLNLAGSCDRRDRQKIRSNPAAGAG